MYEYFILFEVDDLGIENVLVTITSHKYAATLNNVQCKSLTDDFTHAIPNHTNHIHTAMTHG